MLFGQVDRELVNNFTSVAGQCTKETTVAIHDDKPEPSVVFKEFIERLCVKFVVTEVEGGIYGLEWLEVDVDLAFFSFRCNDFAAVDDKSVGGYFGVKLQSLLGGSDGRQDRKSVDS